MVIAQAGQGLSVPLHTFPKGQQFFRSLVRDGDHQNQMFSQAIGKNRRAVSAVSQFGMRNDRTSLVAAKISSSGKTEMESVCNMIRSKKGGRAAIALTQISYGTVSHAVRKDRVNLDS